MNKGVPRNKLIVGTATYGKSFKLSTPSRNQPGDAAYAVGTAGPYTREAGLLSYYEICQKLAQGWKRSYNNEQRVPFADNGNEWVGYDDQQSMKEKGEYVNLKGLGGAMVWSLDLDDFNGKFCGQGRYPLINALKAGLESTTSSSNTNLVGTCTQNHNVVSGETCYLIWTKYGLDEATFYRYNPTINCMPLQIGQVICVKQTTSNTINVNPSGNTICTGTHSVALGETCPLIYGKYGMTEAQLINLNPSLNCNYLPVGLLLNVFKAC